MYMGYYLFLRLFLVVLNQYLNFLILAQNICKQKTEQMLIDFGLKIYDLTCVKIRHDLSINIIVGNYVAY